uniref:Mediator of RNA polymerase II transcription subunit 19 n=1 Tax=Sinocyclocheilus rhinocerous TaxID=307959 RepID=A0A673NAB7_9TELE
YNKFCGKKVKEKLSNFLPELPGMIDSPGIQDNSSMRSLNSFSPLTGAMLTCVRLHTGPLPEQYRLMHIQPPKKKNKHKHKHHRPQDPLQPETPTPDISDKYNKMYTVLLFLHLQNRHSHDHPGMTGAQPSSSLR